MYASGCEQRCKRPIETSLGTILRQPAGSYVMLCPLKVTCGMPSTQTTKFIPCCLLRKYSEKTHPKNGCACSGARRSDVHLPSRRTFASLKYGPLKAITESLISPCSTTAATICTVRAVATPATYLLQPRILKNLKGSHRPACTSGNPDSWRALIRRSGRLTANANSVQTSSTRSVIESVWSMSSSV